MQLKMKLQSLGYIFLSNTDTEVIAHLLSQELSAKKTIKEAFLNLFKIIQGKWAIAAVFEKEPDKVYFAQDGAPLLIGKGKKEYFLASDLSALVRNSSEVCYIKPKQWGYFSKDELVLFDFDGNDVVPEMKKQEAKWEDVDKAGFPHYMLKEIYEQAGIFRKIIDRRIKENGEAPIKRAEEEAKVKVQAMIAEAKTDVEHMRLELKTSIKNELGNMALDIAEKLVRKELKSNTENMELANKLVEEIKFN